MMDDRQDLDALVARLGERGAHPRLASLDDVVLGAIAAERRQARSGPARIGFAALASALAAAAIGGGASMAAAEPREPAIGVSPLAPSSLLSTWE
jgi:hypothetical protein